MADFHTLIDVSQLERLIETGSCRPIDCRFDLLAPEKGHEEYLAGHIPGAVFADLDKDLAGSVSATSGRHPLPAIDDFRATLEGFGIDDTTQVVAYDQASGALAARLWWLMRWIGHEKVAVLDGGMSAWTAAGLPLETAVPETPKGKLGVTPNDGMHVSSDEVEASLGQSSDFVLVDARDAPRFNGETEPIDSVAGHVPGALNLPFASGIQADGRWRSPRELRRQWGGVLGEDPSQPVVVMCGSGVTACHLALSAEIAGLPPPRLYVGSWSEWIRDPSRPVARS